MFAATGCVVSETRPVEYKPREDVAVIQYTGGTTGVPKGAMLTHANIAVNARQVVMWFPGIIDEQQRIFGVLPLFHVFAMTSVMNLGILIGAEMVLVGRDADAADDWIAENVRSLDIVVTADIPLAARCLAAGAGVAPPAW